MRGGSQWRGRVWRWLVETRRWELRGEESSGDCSCQGPTPCGPGTGTSTGTWRATSCVFRWESSAIFYPYRLLLQGCQRPWIWSKIARFHAKIETLSNFYGDKCKQGWKGIWPGWDWGDVPPLLHSRDQLARDQVHQDGGGRVHREHESGHRALQDIPWGQLQPHWVQEAAVPGGARQLPLKTEKILPANLLWRLWFVDREFGAININNEWPEWPETEYWCVL